MPAAKGSARTPLGPTAESNPAWPSLALNSLAYLSLSLVIDFVSEVGTADGEVSEWEWREERVGGVRGALLLLSSNLLFIPP